LHFIRSFTLLPKCYYVSPTIVVFQDFMDRWRRQHIGGGSQDFISENVERIKGWQLMYRVFPPLNIWNFLHETCKFWCIFICRWAKFESITRALYRDANMEGVCKYFLKFWRIGHVPCGRLSPYWQRHSSPNFNSVSSTGHISNILNKRHRHTIEYGLRRMTSSQWKSGITLPSL